MGRIIGIDYGLKRTGVSVTDTMQIIVRPLTTIPTSDILPFLRTYLSNEPVEKIVIGKPYHADGQPTYLVESIDALARKIGVEFPELSIDFADERMTSVAAKQIIRQSGANRTKRRDKALVDKVSAVLILQQYLGHI